MAERGERFEGLTPDAIQPPLRQLSEVAVRETS
jgi:hypothetical protein